MKSSLSDIMEDGTSGKTDADLIYMFYSKTQHLEEVIKEREGQIELLEERLKKLDEFLTNEECKKATYGDPADEFVYVSEVKKAVWGKAWVSDEAQEIFNKNTEEKNELNRSTENDENGSEE